jgi:hypothetical protein
MAGRGPLAGFLACNITSPATPVAAVRVKNRRIFFSIFHFFVLSQFLDSIVIFIATPHTVDIGIRWIEHFINYILSLDINNI